MLGTLRQHWHHSHLPKAVFHRGAFSTISNQAVDLQFDCLTPKKPTSRSGALVILHGLFGSKRNWNSISKAFLNKLHMPIYALDLRNHGHSPYAKPMTYSTMASDVLHFCRKHSLTNVSLLGHSMGGKVAMALALQPDLPPDLLSHLIVVDIAPSKGKISDEFVTYVEAMKRIEQQMVHTRKEANAILETYEKDDAIRAFLLTNLASHHSGDPVKFRIPLDVIEESIPEIGEFPYEPGESKWKGKTLFIKGSRSNYINRRNEPLARQFFPQMEMQSLDAGHWVHAERPTEFLELVTRFTASVS